MLSKKRIKEKVLDICNGAGYIWIEEYEYFEPVSRSTLETLPGVVRGIAESFSLTDLENFYSINFLDRYENLDTIVEHVQDFLAPPA